MYVMQIIKAPNELKADKNCIKIENTWIVLEVSGAEVKRMQLFHPVLCCHTCIHHAADDDWIPQTYQV